MCIKISIEAQDLSMLGGHAPKWEFHPNPQIFYNLTSVLGKFYIHLAIFSGHPMPSKRVFLNL